MTYESETLRLYYVKEYFHVCINQIDNALWSEGVLPKILEKNKYYSTLIISKEHSKPSKEFNYDNYHYHILLRRISPVQTMKDNFAKHLKNFIFDNHKMNIVKNYDHFKKLLPYILKEKNILYYREDESFLSQSLIPEYKPPSSASSNRSKAKELMIKDISSILDARKEKGKKIKYHEIIKLMIQWYLDNTPEHKAWSISNLQNLADRFMIRYTEDGLNKYIGNMRNIWDD